jgi:hypothetical protein
VLAVHAVRASWAGDRRRRRGAAELLLTLLLSLNVLGLALSLLPLKGLDGARLLTAARLRYAR